MTTTEEQALLVTTAHRGVFFGYGVPSDGPTITLKRARMCVYWPAEVRGVLGLTVTGPLGGSKVGPAAPEIMLRDVTAVATCSPAAAAAWEKAPWK